jgi:BirA family biotin operon repressor/biotin-[acetyl-CoA-carboxylase] ligase
MTIDGGRDTKGRTEAIRRDEVESALRTRRFGRRCVVMARVESTNDEAVRLAREGCAEGTVVLAEEQTAGRGRLGRKWMSPSGANLYFSLVLRPTWRASEMPPVSLVVALAVARSLCPPLQRPPTLKWPNDLLIAGKKLSGVLLEMSTEVDRVSSLVVGIGININQGHFPEPLDQTATSLRLQLGRAVDRQAILIAALESLERHIDRLYRGEQAALLREWEMHADWIGREVAVGCGEGPVHGVALGVDEDGALLLRGADGATQRLVAGDLYLS